MTTSHLRLRTRFLILAACSAVLLTACPETPTSVESPTESAAGDLLGGEGSSFTSPAEEPATEEPAEEAPAEEFEAGPAEEPALPPETETDEAVEEPPVEENQTTPEVQRDFFYFSYDDSASTAGVELTKYALQQGFAPNPGWARPWEFLNYETFAKQGQESTGLFEVSMGLWKYNLPEQASEFYDLGVHISAPELTKAERKNIHLTVLIDVSGSMNSPTVLTSGDGFAPSLMDLAKTGLQHLPESLKEGDRVSIVAFSDTAQIVREHLDVMAQGADYAQAVETLAPISGTNLNAGLETAYQLARRHYDPDKINRVVMLTDAFANAGEVDPSVISQATEINDAEGIYFSGLGFGQDFNEAFLNELTEAGKGSYFSVITENDVKRAFQERFMALVNVAAKNVQFRLDFPAALKHQGGAAEETSQVQSEVQPTNFSYNTSQYFWEQFITDGEVSLADQMIKLSVVYTDPLTAQRKQEVFEKPISELLGRDINNIKDARIVTLLTALIKGEKTPEAVKQEMDVLLSDHASAIATEYRSLIQAYLRLKGF